jgi:hypothetical protein
MLTDIFGYWPSFHDAEIHEVNLNVSDREPWVVGSASPVMEMSIHAFEMTKDLTPNGSFVLTKHIMTRLRFRNVEGLQLSDFSFQNCIFELVFGIEPMSYPHGGGPVDGPPPNVLTVRIYSSVGLSGQFKCQSAEVLSAISCDEYGRASEQPG